MYETTRPQVFKIVPVKIRTNMSSNPFEVEKQPSRLSIGETMGDPKPKPASKPADPAFKNALRQRPMRIGLRYIGD